MEVRAEEEGGRSFVSQGLRVVAGIGIPRSRVEYLNYNEEVDGTLLRGRHLEHVLIRSINQD